MQRKQRSISIVLICGVLIFMAACTATPVASPSPPPSPSPEPAYEDWASAYADALLEQEELPSAVTILDIDRDGIPEAWEWMLPADSGSYARCIYGYEDGKCRVWFGDNENWVRLERVFFVQSGDKIRCIASTFHSITGGYTIWGVYELVKGLTPPDETAIIPVTIAETTCSWRPHEYAEQLGDAAVAVGDAQEELQRQALAAVGEQIEMPILTVELAGYPGGTRVEYTVETLAEKLREWLALR